MFRDFQDVSPTCFRQPHVTVGFFDGVHRGHLHLFEELREWAAPDADAVAVTFDVHPLTVLGRREPAMITSLEHRLVLLERAGLDAVVVLDFDRELASWQAERFARELLVERLGSRHLLMGFDASFGQGAAGTAEYLQRHPEVDMEVRSARPLLLEGQPVSSTDVRAAILKGELPTARELLGRAPSIYGEVIHGDGRGRSLGFATANLNLFHSAAPPHGVYLAQTEVGGKRYGALVNIGRRPTFMRVDDPVDYSRYFNEQLDKVEIFIEGFSADLYGERLEASLFRKIRDERRFENVKELVAQIERDRNALLEWWQDR